ncbi:Gluconate transporter [Pseudomonas amygdali pv. tabaci]|uniref:Gluconate transporter n=1 Tax=Pseudomonas amygdali pv. tabaci TaxID=322 RepID=A0A3M6GDW8_PSEAJ|nr:Gluconate transporter [Pseudomonas amygdali pv. tabaci]
MHIEEPVELGELFSAKPDTRRQPGFDISLLIILLPVILMVREYFGLQLKQTLWVGSALQTIVSVGGLIGTVLLWHWLV